MKRVFITGALGFIGRNLGDHYRQEGWDVCGVDVRADPDLNVLAGDIAEPGDWMNAVENCDLVINAAALVSNAASLADSWRVNVLGTHNALTAASGGAAGRFIQISSVRAYSDLDFPNNVDESWPVRPDGNPYVDTKIASEQVALQAHSNGAVSVTVVRPGDVYGPGSRPWTILPVEAIRLGRFVLPAMGRGVFSPIYVADLVDGIGLAAENPKAAGEVFNIVGGDGVPTSEFFGHYFRMLGRRGPINVPTRLALFLATAVSRAEQIRGRETESNPATVRYLARTGSYSGVKAEAMLGFTAKHDLDMGMEKTEVWLDETGRLH